jgi:hypothetical protein
MLKICQGVTDIIQKETGCSWHDFTPEQTFVDTELGYGGTCDLNNPAWTIDFKSKDTAVGQRGWPGQAEQLAAYANGLKHPESRRANIFIGRDDGTVSWYEHKDPMAWHRFCATLRLWQITKKFGPAFEACKDAE